MLTQHSRSSSNETVKVRTWLSPEVSRHPAAPVRAGGRHDGRVCEVCRRLRVERLADVGQEVRRRRRMRRVGRRALQDERLPDLLVAQHADEDLAAADGDLIRNLRRANVQVFKKSSGLYYKKRHRINDPSVILIN